MLNNILCWALMICALSGIIFAIFSKIEENNISIDNWVTITIVLSGSIFLLSLIIFIVTLVTEPILCLTQPTQWKKSYTVKLYALNDSNKLQGRFFLASGYIDQEEVLKYVIQDQDGFKINSVKANKSSLKYVDGDYHMDAYDKEFENNWAKYWLSGPPQDNKYIFYIPHGTIIEQYKVDLE